MGALLDDDLTDQLVPIATDLVTAVHAMDRTAVAAAFTAANHTTGDVGVRHLALVLAAMCIEDQPAEHTLAWTHDPDRYHELRADGVPALLASLRCARSARTEPKGASA